MQKDRADLFNTVPQKKHLDFLYDNNNEIKFHEIMDFLHLEKIDLAGMTNLSIDSVRFDDRMPQEIKEKFLEITNLCELVAQHFDGDKTKTQTWFFVKNPSLNNLSPKDIIKQGKQKKIFNLIMTELFVCSR